MQNGETTKENEIYKPCTCKPLIFLYINHIQKLTWYKYSYSYTYAFNHYRCALKMGHESMLHYKVFYLYVAILYEVYYIRCYCYSTSNNG